MKYLYLFSFIICVTFCSAQTAVPTDSTKKSTSVKSAKNTAPKMNDPKAPAMSKDSAKQSAVQKDSTKKRGGAEKGPGKGYGVQITNTSAQYPGGDDSLAMFLQRNFK